MDEKNVNTSQMLNTSRDVLYGQTEQGVTLENVYQLMLGMNERLTTIEKGMSQVNQMNRTLTDLVSKFTEINSKVAEAECKIKNLKSRCDSSDEKMSKIKHDHTELNKEVKNMKKIQTDANNNLQGISDFMDDFKVNHENNVKDVRSVKSSISKVANDLADNTLELRNEIKTVVNNAKNKKMKFYRAPLLTSNVANHESILLTGDFNSRTAANLDFYEITNTNHDTSDNFNIDFSNNLHKFNMSRIRNSCDKTKNHFGNLLLEMCRNNNLFILNGRVDGDKEGLFTCRQSSVVDYFICTYNLLSCVVSMSVLDFSALFSDVHSPLNCKLVFNSIDNIVECDDIFNKRFGMP
ncbi:unnamed protein product [Mytilus coruscus]|uniref:Endonuclease/exonuclease/phosphatase domain-containing protein n=1 Tax=Mytilus coruscus TaxID=42192 RepID=A0A6J8AEC4_MYTCO|nr:unnamed protein product [Mytilus coruscus]